MLRVGHSWVLVLALVGLAGCTASASLDTEDEEIAVEKLRAKEVAALNDSDVDGVLALCTEDVVYMPTDQPAVSGQAAVRDWLNGYFSATSVSLSYTSEQVTVSGNLAVEPWTALLTVIPTDGSERLTNRLKGVYVYHRDPQGDWKIARAIWNLDKPEPRL